MPQVGLVSGSDMDWITLYLNPTLCLSPMDTQNNNSYLNLLPNGYPIRTSDPTLIKFYLKKRTILIYYIYTCKDIHIYTQVYKCVFMLDRIANGSDWDISISDLNDKH